MFDVPILLIVFNRPETTREVFAVLKEIKPKRLFIVADGPRKNVKSDKALCETTRTIIRNISWKCEAKYLLRKENKGSGRGVAEAISWFFRNVQEGIILEDDCVPDKSFFRFCKELLSRYRNNRNIMHISGDNFQGSHRRGKASYYFSIFPNTWGWATWRRAWKLYKFSRKSWDRKFITDSFYQQSDIIYWTTIFDEYLQGRRDVWDYQWLYTCWENVALSIVPQYNLVTNTGMNASATHTNNIFHLQIRSKTITFPLTHPTKIEPDKRADLYTQHKVYFGGSPWRQNLPLYVRQFIDSLQF